MIIILPNCLSALDTYFTLAIHSNSSNPHIQLQAFGKSSFCLNLLLSTETEAHYIFHYQSKRKKKNSSLFAFSMLFTCYRKLSREHSGLLSLSFLIPIPTLDKKGRGRTKLNLQIVSKHRFKRWQDIFYFTFYYLPSSF